METLNFRFENGNALLPEKRNACLVGVVGSGNLEVLIEPAALDGRCEVEVNTAATGFGTVWQAVLDDFAMRWKLGNIRISINDMGATPAVVSLRLDQAAESLLGSAT